MKWIKKNKQTAIVSVVFIIIIGAMLVWYFFIREKPQEYTVVGSVGTIPKDELDIPIDLPSSGGGGNTGGGIKDNIDDIPITSGGGLLDEYDNIPVINAGA